MTAQEAQVEPQIAASEPGSPRPRSAVSAPTGWLGVAGLGLWALYSHHVGLNGPLAALCGVLAAGVPMVLWSVLIDKVHRNPSTGIDWSLRRPWAEVFDSGLVKLAGLWTTWGLIALCYFLGRWYWQGSYLFAMQTLRAFLPFLLVLSVPYVLWLERHVVDVRDGAWTFGRVLLGAGWSDPETKRKLADHARAWVVKGFFTAFMIQTLPGNWANVMAVVPARWLDSPVALGDGLVAVMFMIDVTLATVGYLLTMRPLDSHIRRANPYAAAWMAALICYPPFIMMNPGGPFDYGPGLGHYDRWLAGYPVLLALDAFALIALTGVYAWATLAFGLRFSNLTHRGIVTNGPYAFSKHPAYLSKNLFWWLQALPFFAASGSWQDAVRNSAILALIGAVYFWRAKTEERHLSADPAYRDYAGWMAANGAITKLFTRKPARPMALVAAE